MIKTLEVSCALDLDALGSMEGSSRGVAPEWSHSLEPPLAPVWGMGDREAGEATAELQAGEDGAWAEAGHGEGPSFSTRWMGG